MSVVVAAAPPEDSSSRHGPVGWETYRHPERLAEIGNDARTKQFSSFDRTGGNDDGFGGRFSCLRTTDQGCLLAEHLGAGEIGSIWFTRDGGDVTKTGTITVELDGTRVLHAKLQDVVDGKLGAPFVYPLVANADQSSGGVYIKVPMPYRESMRVYTENNPLFYHVTYREFADAEGIETFDPEDPATDVVEKLAAAGTKDPKPELPGSSTSTHAVDVAPGETTTLATFDDPGALTALVVRLPQMVPAPTQDVTARRGRQHAPSPMPEKERWVRQLREPALRSVDANDTEEVLREARLRITFDGQRTVDAPLGEFFGSGLGLYPVRSLMFGMDPENSTLSSWWLMPFAKSAKVELHNGSDVAIEGGSADITASRSPQWRGGLASGEIGYFRATAVRSEAELGKDHVFLDATGRGRVVGVTQTVEGLDAEGWRRGYLEGDERVFVDGSRSPDLHGTGTEDFYEGGWYFNKGAFTAPMTGSPVPDRDDCLAGCTAMYRLMLAEGVDFGSSIRFGIEHGPGNDQPAIEASTTYWYGQEFGTLHWTDGLDVGDADSEAAHAYTSEAPGEVQEATSRFEGLDGPAEPVTLDTRATDAAVRFRLAIDRDNDGVVLRRTSDQSEGFQSAQVTVDGTEAGVWNQPLANPDLRWLDDSHVLPPALTR
ncbi:MAG TPA: glycoside hydrolase family 172 protein, partial [Actinopolymorphaceae bacterium]